MSLREAIDLLRRSAYVQQADLVAGEFVARDVTRRNVNFSIQAGDSAFFVKQSGQHDHSRNVAQEATCLRWLWGPSNRSIHPHLPKVAGYHDAQATLVLELLPNANTLHDYHRRLGRFPEFIGREIGGFLANLHSLDLPESARSDLVQIPDWSYAVHRPDLGQYTSMSAGNLEVLRRIQARPSVMEKLDHLQKHWAPETLIHYDLKWDNCLVTPGRYDSRLRVIDWEFAGIGDPRWDTGHVFAEYLLFWIASMPIPENVPPEQLPALARYPLEKMHGALRAFWLTYIETVAGSQLPTDARSTLQYAAVHLLEAAFARTQDTAQLGTHVLLTLQLAVNMLQNTEQAVRLVGLGEFA